MAGLWLNREVHEEGLAQIDQGLALYEAKVGEHNVPYFLALLAETQNDMGRSQEAEQSLTNALAIIEKNGERFYEAELYRLKGELTLQKLSVVSNQLSVPSPQVEAKECFLKAIDIAGKQEAKSLELRAATSLARLWQRQGKKAEAHKLLSEVYNWFTEGFDTKDLQEAKALLEELGQ